MGFGRPAAHDTGVVAHLLQIIYAWEGDTGKGQPLDLTEVDSATKYAVEAKNKNASGLSFRFLTTAGANMLRGAGATVYLGQNVEVTAGKTIDGVDVGTHAATTDTHIAATTGIHGATAAATANKLLIRDAAGRAKVVAPSVADDIARKDTVDTAVGNWKVVDYDGEVTTQTFQFTVPLPADWQIYYYEVLVLHRTGGGMVAQRNGLLIWKELGGVSLTSIVMYQVYVDTNPLVTYALAGTTITGTLPNIPSVKAKYIVWGFDGWVS